MKNWDEALASLNQDDRIWACRSPHAGSSTCPGCHMTEEEIRKHNENSRYAKRLKERELKKNEENT